MIIAIDGPAGAGKSTTARLLARRLGYAYIDTGAMYRAIALAVLEGAIDDPRSAEAMAQLARDLPISMSADGQKVFVGNRDITDLIRTSEIGELTSQISTIPEVRSVMVDQQRRLARRGEIECGGAVLEGRDIQTVVFPDAPVKIFLTAGPDTRAQRRQVDHLRQGVNVSLEQARSALATRDERDMGREVSPLQAAPDAVHIATDGLGPEAVVEAIVAIAQQRTESP